MTPSNLFVKIARQLQPDSLDIFSSSVPIQQRIQTNDLLDHEPWRPVSTRSSSFLLFEGQVELIWRHSLGCSCSWAPEGCTVESHFTPGASPAEDTATALEQYKLVQRKYKYTFNKLKDFKMKIFDKLDEVEAMVEEMTGPMEIAQVDGKANTDIKSKADIRTDNDTNANTITKIATALINDVVKSGQASPCRKSDCEDMIANLVDHLKIIDAQFEKSAHCLATMNEFAEVAGKINADPTTQRLLDLLAV